MRFRVPHVLIALLAAGCAEEAETIPSRLTEVDGAAPAQAQVVPAVGEGVVEVPIRLVNTYGVAVPGTTLDVTVAGRTAVLQQSALPVDAFGYATARVVTDGPEAFTVTVTGSADGAANGASGTGWSVEGSLPRLRLASGAVLPAGAPAPAFAAAGTDGAAFAGGDGVSSDQIWWQPYAPGEPAYMVADLPSEIGGMWGAHIDADGVLDLAVFAGPQVVLLRGRPGGGYGWGGAWTAEAGEIVGLGVADLTGDRLTDVAIGINDESTGSIEILSGDGAWGFVAGEPLDLEYPVDSITAADEDGDGLPDVTVLTGYGTIYRYTRGEGEWAGGQPSTIDPTAYSALEGSTLLPMVDLDGDGSLELIVEGAGGASSQDLVFFTLGETVTKFELTYGNYHAALADLDKDGAVDMLAMEDDVLHVIRYVVDEDSAEFVARNFSDLGAAGPIAAGDGNADGAPDVAVFSEDPLFHAGVFTEGASADPFSSQCGDGIDNDEDGQIDSSDGDCGDWRAASWGWRTFLTTISGPAIFFDADGDGLDDVLAFVEDNGALELWLWRFDVDSGATQLLSPDTLSFGAAIPLGLARCGEVIFALTEAGGTRTLARISSGDGDNLTQVGDEEVAGTLLACGHIADSPIAAVSTSAGAWTTYNAGLNQVSTGSGGAYGALAMADTDGDGTSEVVGCEGAGCQVVAADLDGDGRDEIVRSAEGGFAVEGWGASTTIVGEGYLSLGDLDRDGLSEVLVTDAAAGRVLIYRGVYGGVAPAIVYGAGARVIAGPVGIGDVDGSGLPELLALGEDGELSHTANTVQP